MNILCMDIRLLLPALRDLGHNALSWVPENGGLHNLPEFLREQDFKPDLVIQGENLGPRRQLEGLEEIDCPKIFWAIDSHLNLWWHKYYARLFDAVLTPHLSLWEGLPTAEKHPLVRQMARQGVDMPWRPHAERPYGLAFVGVQNKHRPLRAWLCELLSSRWPLETRQNISFAEMLELYRQARLVPNEAISFEVNYRLMEAASAGAVPVTPDIGSDQDNLFEPGWEIVVYNNACELMEEVEELLADPRQAESIAYAAWQRVQRDHLPVNRARQILNVAEAVRRGKAPEEYKGFSRLFHFDSSLWMARVQGSRGGVAGFSGSGTGKTLPVKIAPPGDEQTAETFNLSLRLLLETRGDPGLLEIVQEYFDSGLYPENMELAVAASFGARRLGNPDLANLILARAGSCGGIPFFLPPASEMDFCLAWAEVLIRKEIKAYSGFLFDPKFHLPATAMEVLIYAELMLPKEGDATGLLELANLTLQGRPSFAYFHLGYLARLCLASPKSWEAQLEYGLQNLLCYRLSQGLHEIFEAAEKALDAGKTEEFKRLFKLHDKSGAIVRALDLEYI